MAKKKAPQTMRYGSGAEGMPSEEQVEKNINFLKNVIEFNQIRGFFFYSCQFEASRQLKIVCRKGEGGFFSVFFSTKEDRLELNGTS